MKRFLALFLLSLLLVPGHSAAEGLRKPKKDLAGELRTMIAAQLGVDPSRVGPDLPLGRLGADELDIVEIIMAAEELIGAGIPDPLIEEVIGPFELEHLPQKVTLGKLLVMVERVSPRK